MKKWQVIGLFSMAFIGGILGSAALNFFFTVEAASEEIIDELNVKRINVVEDNGNFAMVLANSTKLPGSIRDGKQSGMRTGVPGIIFYNNLGDEIGGLIFPARNLENGFDGGVQLSMDQIKQTGQAIALRHWRNGNYVRSNLEITDYSTEKFAGDLEKDPEVQAVLAKLQNSDENEQEEIYFKEFLPLIGEKGYLAHRIFLGSEGAESRRAMLEIKDSRSRPRIRLMVNESDEPVIEILDENGEVVASLEDLINSNK